MARFDHLAMPVSDWRRSRDWYVETLGLTIEFELPERETVALQDENDFTLFLAQGVLPAAPDQFAFYFQVADVHRSHAELCKRGLRFNHPPQSVFWGFGCELPDPDGYRIRLWDERSMNAKQPA